ncbi:hypothetical protein FQR65_LT20003 [Abscondita terminalis]|nr:hypothetical protein FQR65_LT20003 [Abscondita terminalis]
MTTRVVAEWVLENIPHDNMEIISKFRWKAIWNTRTAWAILPSLKRADIQVMSAGTGILITANSIKTKDRLLNSFRLGVSEQKKCKLNKIRPDFLDEKEPPQQVTADTFFQTPDDGRSMEFIRMPGFHLGCGIEPESEENLVLSFKTYQSGLRNVTTLWRRKRIAYE